MLPQGIVLRPLGQPLHGSERQRVVRPQQVTLGGQRKFPRAVFSQKADGGDRPQQPIEQGRIDTHLLGEADASLSCCPVEMVEDAQFGPGVQRLAPPASGNQIHDLLDRVGHSQLPALAPCPTVSIYICPWRIVIQATFPRASPVNSLASSPEERPMPRLEL